MLVAVTPFRARGRHAIPRRHRRQAAERVVGRVDPADGAVHARAERRDSGGRLAAQDVVGVGVGRACPIGHTRPFAEGIGRVDVAFGG